MTAPFHKTDHYSPAPQYTMPNTYLDKAIEAVPKFEERISLFTKKLRLAQYADSTLLLLKSMKFRCWFLDQPSDKVER
jgi:hypothetical protein